MKLKKIFLPVMAFAVLGLGGTMIANHSLTSTVHAQGNSVQVQKTQPSVAEKEVPDTKETGASNQEKNQSDNGHTDPPGSVDHQFEGTE